MKNFKLLSGKSDGTSICSKIFTECQEAFIEILNKNDFVETTIFPITYLYNNKQLIFHFINYRYCHINNHYVYTTKVEFGKYICDLKHHSLYLC